MTLNDRDPGEAAGEQTLDIPSCSWQCAARCKLHQAIASAQGMYCWSKLAATSVMAACSCACESTGLVGWC